MTNLVRENQLFETSSRRSSRLALPPPSRKVTGLLAGFFVIGLTAGLLAIAEPVIAESKVATKAAAEPTLARTSTTRSDFNTDASRKRCPSPCTPIPKSSPDSSVILSGESVTSSLHIKFQCKSQSSWLNIAILVAPDERINPSELQQAKKSAHPIRSATQLRS